MDLHHLIETAGAWSYVVVFAVVAGETSAFIGLILPGETLILLAAALAERGELNPYLLTLAVIGGGIAGDSLGYALGHWFEHRPSAERLRRRIPARGRIDRSRAFLRSRGGTAVFTGRLVGFIRSFLPFAAGAAGMPYRPFLLYSTAASVVWGTGNVLAGYFLGSSAERILRTAGLAGVAAAAAAVLAVLWMRRRGTGLPRPRCAAAPRRKQVAAGGRTVTRRGSRRPAPLNPDAPHRRHPGSRRRPRKPEASGVRRFEDELSQTRTD
ncbi:DedA family protein [Streptomyces sp. NPDC001982]|uniref:DedA family protein n=1 Tax=Streptomyces sp. NPDC001982 TaxID=3154405 RepID=UPI0033255376